MRFLYSKLFTTMYNGAMAMAMVEMNELLSASQAARILGITKSLVCRYCRDKKFGSLIDGRYLILRKDLEKFRKTKRRPGRPAVRKPSR